MYSELSYLGNLCGKMKRYRDRLYWCPNDMVMALLHSETTEPEIAVLQLSLVDKPDVGVDKLVAAVAGTVEVEHLVGLHKPVAGTDTEAQPEEVVDMHTQFVEVGKFAVVVSAVFRRLSTTAEYNSVSKMRQTAVAYKRPEWLTAADIMALV